MTRVIGYPRLHAGLFDLGTATPRQYGGIGMAIDGPPTVVSVELARRFSIGGLELIDDAGAADLEGAVERLLAGRSSPTVSVTIHALPPQHIGLGTKTTLVLAVLKAISEAAGLDASDAELRVASGRGGTSGIGIHTFFAGGLVVDGGHRTDAPRTYQPSSSGVPGRLPPLVARVSIPETWMSTLLLPDGSRPAGASEAVLFESLTPVPDDEVRRTIAVAVMGIAASAAGEDFTTFAASLNEVQVRGFKAREISAQPHSVGDLLRELCAVPGCGAGMSSMGPLLFAVCDGGDSAVHKRILEIARSGGATVLGTVGFRNAGFDIG